MPKRKAASPDQKEAKRILDECWDVVLNNDATRATAGIRDLVNSDQTAIRFCLPTQLLGKLTENGLDTLCLQRGKAIAEADKRWNARTFCTRVIVPWNRDNQSVLGPGGDPYVSNPLRRPRLDHGMEQLDVPEEWKNLCQILGAVESISTNEYTKEVFLEVLSAIRDRLRDFDFRYVVPQRVSLEQAEHLVELFLTEKAEVTVGCRSLPLCLKQLGNG